MGLRCTFHFIWMSEQIISHFNTVLLYVNSLSFKNITKLKRQTVF